MLLIYRLEKNVGTTALSDLLFKYYTCFNNCIFIFSARKFRAVTANLPKMWKLALQFILILPYMAWMCWKSNGNEDGYKTWLHFDSGLVMVVNQSTPFIRETSWRSSHLQLFIWMRVLSKLTIKAGHNWAIENYGLYSRPHPWELDTARVWTHTLLTSNPKP